MTYWWEGHISCGVTTLWSLKVVCGRRVEPVKSLWFRSQVNRWGHGCLLCFEHVCVVNGEMLSAHRKHTHRFRACSDSWGWNNQIGALWCADVIILWHATGIILWHKVIICRDWNLPYSSQLKQVICSAHGTLWSYFFREMKKREGCWF